MRARLCVVGAGRSGAVTAACLAELGHTVFAVDVDAVHVARLSDGKAPFFEPGLDDIIERHLKAGRLSFTTSYADSVPDAGFVMLCVGTPASGDGSSDLSALHQAVDTIAPLLKQNAVVITRSTVPVGTNAALAGKLSTLRPDVAVVSNPEFLREGHAVDDFLRPDRVVIGSDDAKAAHDAAGLYQKLDRTIITTDLETAEVIKYAANAYLAASVSFINEIANICDRTGADVSEVGKALSLDKRIGPNAYLNAGIGYGGSCLPKDISALIHSAEQLGYEPALLRAVMQTNLGQPHRIVEQLGGLFGDVRGLSIAVLGISFKGGTFDARSSPAISVIESLHAAGATVRAYDPYADGALPDRVRELAAIAADPYSAVEGANAVVVATDHEEFLTLDYERMARSMASAVLIDGRNWLDAEAVTREGFSYLGVGRPRRGD